MINIRNSSMSISDDGTALFYATHAATYAARGRSSVNDALQSFAERLPPGGRVLELGCGGGHDSAYLLSRGFDVTPTDGSPEIAEQAERLLKRPVAVLAFGDLEADSRYDGIWANACLLHVERQDLLDILSRIRKALVPGGRFYASFKAGNGEGRDRFGRYYNYPTAEWLSAQYANSGWSDIDIQNTRGQGYDGVDTDWLRVTAFKQD